MTSTAAKPFWWDPTRAEEGAERDAAADLADLAGALPIDPGQLAPAPRMDDPPPTCCDKCSHYWALTGRAPKHTVTREEAKNKLLAAARGLDPNASGPFAASLEAHLFAAALLYAAACRSGGA